MTADESEAASKVLSFRESSGLGAASTLEGLQLVRAFTNIKAPADRQKVIELAKRLSTAGANTKA
jgi:hypothetical protein